MEFTLSSGVIVVRKAQDGWRFLILRAYRNWDFPKGLVEDGETALGAAQREVREETGITDLEFPFGDVHRDTEPYGRGKVARYHVGETRSENLSLPVNKELGRPEHHEYRWASLAEAKGLLPPRLAPIMTWAHALLTGSRHG